LQYASDTEILSKRYWTTINRYDNISKILETEGNFMVLCIFNDKTVYSGVDIKEGVTSLFPSSFVNKIDFRDR